MVHRLLKADLHWKNGYSKRDRSEEWIAKAAEHASIQEQNAVSAERDTDDLKKVQYMVPFVGQVFQGKVNSITSFGMFVELENGIDGLVHINMMNDDYYFYDEEHFLLVGRRTGQTYHLGQEVTVTLVKADMEKKQIDFVLGEVDNLMAIQDKLTSQQTSRSKGSSHKKGNPSRSKSHQADGESGRKTNAKKGRKTHVKRGRRKSSSTDRSGRRSQSKKQRNKS